MLAFTIAIGILAGTTTLTGGPVDGAGGGVPLSVAGTGGAGGPTCYADVNDDNLVDVGDLLDVIVHWGTNHAPCDIVVNGMVDVQDLLAVIGAWGTCDPVGPANDDCVDAINVCPPVELAATSIGATTDTPVFCGAVWGAFDVWFRYVAGADGPVVVSVCEPGFAAQISVHANCPGTADNLIECNSDGNCGVVFLAQRNYDYLIRVAGQADATSDFTLVVNGTACAP